MFDYDSFQKSACTYESVNDIMFAQNAAEIVEAETISESPVVQDYIDGPLTGNTAAKKLFAAAISIANDKGYISLPEKYSNPQSVAAIADKAVETIKLAHDVATGVMDEDEVIDYGVKKAASWAKTAVDHLIDKGTPIVADRVTDAIVSVFPPFEVARPYVHKVAHFVAPKVKQFVRKGIDAIAEVAKPIIKETVKTVKTVAKKIWNVIFG